MAHTVLFLSLILPHKIQQQYLLCFGWEDQRQQQYRIYHKMSSVLHKMDRYKQWNGLLEWNTGLDY